MARKGETIVSNVMWKLAEQVLSQVVSLIVSVVLARLLLPDDYGVIAMITVFITIANAFVTSGIPSALVQKKDSDQEDFSSVFFFNLGLSIVLYAIVFFAAPIVASFYSTPILTPVTRVMGLRLIVAGVSCVQNAYISKHMLFRKHFYAALTGTIISGVVGVIMAYAGFGVWALVTQTLLNAIVNMIVMFFVIGWRPTLFFSWKKIARLVNYGWKILFEGVSNTVAGQLTNLVIGRVYTSGDLGFYTKAQQFPNLIITNISTAISSVLFPAMAMEQDDPLKVKRLLRTAVSTSTYVVFPMLIGLGLVAKPFVSVVLTDKWLACVPYIQIFCLVNLGTVGMVPRHQALNGTGRSDIFMYEHLFSRIVSIVLLLAIYKISVMAIALSVIVSTVVMILTVMYTSKRYNGYGYREQIADVMPTVLGCVVMAVPVLLIGTLNLPSLVVLILQVLFGAAAYITYSILFKLQEFATIMRYARNLFGKHRQ